MLLSERISETNGELLTRAEVARLLDAAPSTIDEWTRRGDIPRPIVIGSRRRWNKDDLVAWAQGKEERQ